MRSLKLLFAFCLLLSFTEVTAWCSAIFCKSVEKSDTIKIGLLISDNKAVAAKNGAGLAIIKANARGGCRGIPFKLEVRSMEGPWGTGSKQTVNLIFKKEVWAILGSHDGRNAHLAEQVTAKARIVFLSAWTADPTLSQAFVPWYFSCVPNNLQQADILIDEIYNERRYARVMTISDNSYDSDLALKSFVNKLTEKNRASLTQLSIDVAVKNITELANKLIVTDTECIVIFGAPSSSIKLLSILKERKVSKPVFGVLSLLSEDVLKKNKLSVFDGVTLVSSEHWYNKEGLAFGEEYKKLYGAYPDPVAAYAFDGMNIIIEAVRSASPERENLQKAMAGTKYKGVTGLIKFDERGNRIGPFQLMKIKNGAPSLFR